MKYSEFNNEWSDMELQYSESEIYIYCDGVMIGKVSRLYLYMMQTHYEGFEGLPLPVAMKLFADMAMLSETPLAEREEEKKYQFLLSLPIGIKSGIYGWLNQHTKTGEFKLSSRDNTLDMKTIFTESEISQMDITGFKKIEAME